LPLTPPLLEIRKSYHLLICLPLHHFTVFFESQILSLHNVWQFLNHHGLLSQWPFIGDMAKTIPMKKNHFLTGILICLFFFQKATYAQVKIGGVPGPPVSSAVLELDGGGTRALRLPIVNSKDELGNLPNPVNGLMVYSNHTHSVHVYTNGFWTELKETPTSYFDLPHYGNYLAPNIAVLQVRNATNGGIGLAGEGTLRGIEGQSLTGSGVLGSSENGTGLYGSSNHGTGIYGTSNNGIGISGYSGSNIGILANTLSGKAIWANAGVGTAIRGNATLGTAAYFSNASPVGKALVIDTGRVGIGALLPTAMLDIDATRFASSTAFSINGTNPTMNWRQSGVLMSIIKLEENNLLMGTVIGNSLGKFMVQTNGTAKFQVDGLGRTSIGTTSDVLNGMLNINSLIVGPTMVLNAVTPEIAIRTSNIDRAYINYENGLMIGTLPTTNLNLYTNNQPRLEIAGSNGYATFNNRLGIGASPSTGKLVVDAVGDAVTETISVNDENPLIQLKASGVNKGFLQVATDDVKLGLSATNATGKLILRTGGLDRVFLDNSGNLSIGTDAVAAGYRLNVRGRIMGEEIRIQALVNWPDYVFEPGYQLKPLKEVADHIKTYNHLPGIPDAAEVAKEGFDMGAMQAKLLEKIEELTLYLLEANKRIEQLEKTVAQPQKKTWKPNTK